MDFEDLMCMTDDEIEYGICCIAERFDKDVRPGKAERHKAEIREDLTEEFHGCFPYHDGEDETPCYLVGCDYGCEHCPMKGARVVGWNPKSSNVNDWVIALIKSIKMDANYNPTGIEIETAIEIIRR